MKKIIFLTVACCFAAFSCVAQRETIRIQPVKREVCVIKASHTTARSFGASVKVDTRIENVRGKGNTLVFKANTPLSKVLVYGHSKGKPTIFNSLILKKNTRGWQIYLDAPAYKDGVSNLIEFYIPGHDDKPVWVAVVDREIPGS